MGCRFDKPTDRESAVSFRVVEIFVVNSNNSRIGKQSRFLLVDNRRETLETVQSEMQDFVKTAILANRLGKQASSRKIARNF